MEGTRMFSLGPWRLSHWLMLLTGSVCVATYLNLLSWDPIVGAIQGLAPQGSGFIGAVTAGESIVGLLTLLLLTPLAAVVALFLLLMAWIGIALALRPVTSLVGIPDWAGVLVVAGVSVVWIYARSDGWVPWASAVIDRLLNAYLIPLL
jgi:hypothetical protein